MTDATNLDDVLDFAWDGPLPGSAVDTRARLLLLDSLGCIRAGLSHARPRALATALAAWMPGPLRLPGVEAGLSEAGAATVLAAAMCWDEANEGLARAHGRPALAVAPLCLAALAIGRASLGEALAALAVGYETGGRAGELWRIRPGMHVDGSWHSIGAAACAVRLAGGDRATAARAMRLVACQLPFALYAPIAAGLDGRNSYPAHAVLLGVLAAASAQAGMDAPAGALAEARALVLGELPPPQRAPAGAWLLAEAYLKPFAGVRHAHYGAAAALELRPRLQGGPVAIARIGLATYGEALRYASNPAPTSAIAAQFSLSWAVAAALLQGDLGPEAYADAALADPRLRELEARVVLSEDTALTQAGARGATLTLQTTAGETLRATVTQVPGDPSHPLGAAEVAAKFRRYAGIEAAAASALVAALLEGGPASRPGGLFG